MSLFYQSLSFKKKVAFQRAKQTFKKNKPCAVCGKRFPGEQMMVAHIIPARNLAEEAALFDTTNWEVRCIECERRLNQQEDKARASLLNNNKG